MTPARTALVTGAARGIGAAVARRLAACGWNLVLVDLCQDDPALDYPLGTQAELDAVVEDCGGRDQVLAIAADVRDQAAMDLAAKSARERFGGLDAAVAAAGAIAGGHDSWDTADTQWESMIGINLTGVWRTTRAAVPALMSRPEPRQGRIVAIASVAAQVGLPRLAAYAASKHGVVGLVRSLAAELAPFGITANAVAPGSTHTAMIEQSARIYALDDPAELASHHLVQRLVQPDEVAALVAWLCGPESSAITGAVLPVDAGMTAR